MPEWLMDRLKPVTNDDIEEIDRNLAMVGTLSRAQRRNPGPLAVSLHDITIHDTLKWFGGANIRIDALVITGQGKDGDAQSFYMPKTASFDRVAKGETLPIGSGGLLVFYGPAAHFLDISIMVSRDRKDSENLAQILAGGLASPEVSKSLATLMGLAVAAPQAAIVAAAVEAAAKVGDLAFHLLQAATGATIGLYRNCHLEYRDRFGIGSHPGPGGEIYRAQDFSFRYRIEREAQRSDRRQPASSG